MRSLGAIARDLGRALGCGGLVETLRRTRVGPFTAEQGIGVDTDWQTARTKLLPISLVTQSPGTADPGL